MAKAEITQVAIPVNLSDYDVVKAALARYKVALDVIDTSVGLLRQLGGMMPGTRQVVDLVVDLLTSVTEDAADA